MPKRAFVLGSGFSKSLLTAMPLINDFFSRQNREIVDNSLKTDGLSKFDELFAFIERHYSYFGKSKYSFNIELFSTFLHSYSFAESPEDYQNLFIVKNQLLSYINHLIKYSSLQPNYLRKNSTIENGKKREALLSKFKRLYSFIDSCDNNTSFITYNYDLLLERILLLSDIKNKNRYWNSNIPDLLRKKGLHLSENWEYADFIHNCTNEDEFTMLTRAYSKWKISHNFNITTGYGFQAKPFEKYFANNGNISYADSKIKIYKLHGSINWFKKKGKDQATTDNIGIGIPSTDICYKNLEHYRTFTNTNEDLIRSMFDNDPIIVPMTHTKGLYLEIPLFSSLWSQAYTVLKQAEEIYFIGYSFPKTDINNTYFYREFAHKFKGVCVFYYRKYGNKQIENKSTLKSFEKRFYSYFPEAKESIIKNIDALDYIEMYL